MKIITIYLFCFSFKCLLSVYSVSGTLLGDDIQWRNKNIMVSILKLLAVAGEICVRKNVHKCIIVNCGKLLDRKELRSIKKY